MNKIMPYSPDPQWVMLHEEISNGAKVAYTIMRGSVKHVSGSFPETAFELDANWLAAMMVNRKGLPLDRKTAANYLLELVKHGALRIKEASKGVRTEFEFVVDPGSDYKGDTKVSDREKRLRRAGIMKRTSRFHVTDLSGHPTTTGTRLRRDQTPGASDIARQRPTPPAKNAPTVAPTGGPGSGSAKPEVAQPYVRKSEPVIAEEPPFTPEPPVNTSPEVAELARLLADKCQGKGLQKRGLLGGEAARVAESCAGLLESGWTPEKIATQLSSLVSDKIHSAEQFLIKKVPDLGAPPVFGSRDNSVEIPKVNGQEVDFSQIDMWDWNSDEVAEKPTVKPEEEPTAAAEVPQTRLAELARRSLRRR